MSLFDTFDTDKDIKPDRPYLQKDSSFIDVVEASFDYTLKNQNFDSASSLVRQEFRKAEEDAKRIIGDDYNLSNSPSFDPTSFDEFSIQGASGGVELMDKQQKVYDDYVKDLKLKNPDKYKDLKTLDDIRESAKLRAKESEKNFTDVRSRASGRSALLGSLVGGFGASLADPLNILTLPLGAGAGKTLLKTVAIEAGIASGTEAITQQGVEAWQKELGNEYGLKDKAEAVGMAALFGGSLPVIGKGAKVGAQKSSRYIFNKIGLNKKTPLKARTAAKVMERNLHVIENSPYVNRNNAEHIKVFNEIMETVNRGEPIDFTRVEMSNKEFNSIDTRILDTDDKSTIIAKQEIEKFQTEKLTPEQQAIRNDLIEQEIINMKNEVNDITQTLENLDNLQSTQQWQNKLLRTNEQKLNKILENKKGKTYTQLRKVAEERLDKGYVNNKGVEILPNKTFIDNSVGKKIANQRLDEAISLIKEDGGLLESDIDRLLGNRASEIKKKFPELIFRDEVITKESPDLALLKDIRKSKIKTDSISKRQRKILKENNLHNLFSKKGIPADILAIELKEKGSLNFADGANEVDELINKLLSLDLEAKEVDTGARPASLEELLMDLETNEEGLSQILQGKLTREDAARLKNKIEASNKTRKDYALDEPESIPLQRQNEINKELESPEHIKAVEVEFKRTVESNPDQKIIIERDNGEEVTLTLKELENELEIDSKVMNEINSCGLG